MIQQANGLRYAASGVRVGGTGPCHFAGTNSKQRKRRKNAATPTTMAPTYFVGDRVPAVLGGPCGLLVLDLQDFPNTAAKQH